MAGADVQDEALIRGEADPEDRAETAAARAATALADPRDATLPARHRFDRSQVEVIRKSVAKDLSDVEMAWFLEVAARYRLDPLLKEIYAVKFEGSTVTIFTGRDGLLKAAKNSGKFVRMQSHVVREKDEFTKIVDTMAAPVEGREILHVYHEQKGMGSSDRGPIIGSYALVWTTDSQWPWYAEATWEEYGKHRQKDRNSRDTAWTIDSQKGYPEAMMVKVAESIALRKACGLSGIVSEDEIAKQLPDERVPALSGGGAAPEIPWPEGDAGTALQVLVTRCNELVPGSYRPAKVAMEIGTGDPERLAEFAERMRRFIAAREPNDPLVVTDAEAVEEAEPVVEVPWDPARYEELSHTAADIEAGMEEPDMSPEDRQAAEAQVLLMREELQALEAARERDGGE